ncbi:TPM domain-containing protein [Streptomyces sp. SCA3-4]|uniref:TPM domain-containing protein n=1 Tax=Streptomyces sichuanensis TaxID=2871810 RepID=UPI001CE2B2EC|nr:TPM domain-containing protein [Streptomyces sichuanensis]MCA6094121.1 TPM domain-containing protein [Streptomyces sichuanensis]
MTRLSWWWGPRAPSWAMISALLALCAFLLPTAPAARADTPLDLEASGRITDTVGALGRRRGQVEAALERLHASQHIQLYVTYVRDFSGRPGRGWADATADRNGLGPRAVLLAIATHARQYAVSADKDSGFRKAQLKEVATTAIEPALAEHDWAGAAVGAADGYRAVLQGEPVRPPVIRPGAADPGGDGLVPGEQGVWVPIAGGLVLCLTGLYACSRRSRRARAARRRRAAARDHPVLAATTRPGLTRMVQPLTPLPELAAEAAVNLVCTDDAVRTSAEELVFATAQLGEAATRPFAEAVDWARGELADAFRLRQRLDDAPFMDQDIRRHMLDEICSRCTSANRRLDAESAAFDRLRDLKANGALILAQAEAMARTIAPRVATAEAVLAALAPYRPDDVLAPVAAHPGEARDRLAFADTALAEAHAAITTGDTDHAAVSLRAAEAALSQARTLTSAVLRHTHGLTTTNLPAGPARAVLVARAEVAAARDYIGTHRGAIGCGARTRLAEAERRLARVTGPAAAAEALRAAELAQEARALAEENVTEYDAPTAPHPTRILGGALLGGIILAGLLPATFGGGATRGRLAH